MRILYVCLDRGIPIGGTKGASIHVSELVTALRDEGHDTAVVARGAAGGLDPPVFIAPSPPRVSRLAGRSARRDAAELLAGPRFTRTIERAAAAFEPEAIYERYALFRTEGLAAARRRGVPFVLEVNAPLSWEEARFRGLKLRAAARRRERRIWRGADLIVVPSEQLGGIVRRDGARNVIVVPNAVDPELFTPEIDGTATRRRLGIDGRFVVGFTGSLKPWHDLRTLIEAAGSSRPPVAVLLVGEGPERRRLEDLATGVGTTVVFAGPVSHAEVPRYLAAMDVCFAGLPADPAVQYFSPLKAMEYLAAGRATVAARAGSLQPFIDAGAALGYRPGDADDLAATLRSLMENEELRTRIARAGQGYARERTWANAARATVDAIGGLAGPAADS